MKRRIFINQNSGSISTRILVCALLLLAATHAVFGNFQVNLSYIDLEKYQAGAERTPFQERIGMMPLLQWAHNSPFAQRESERLSHFLDIALWTTHREVTPEAVASIAAGLLSMYLLLAFMIWYGARRFGRLWWMPAACLILMYTMSVVVRYESPLRYPYDLPHLLLFGVASLCVLEGWWGAVAVLFLVDLPVRGTAIYLAAVLFTVAWSRGRKRIAIVMPFLMGLCFLAFRSYVHRRFQNAPTETWVRLYVNRDFLLRPLHWPQIASSFGFLLLPLLLGTRYLSRSARAFMIGAIPPLLATLIFGVLIETRIFAEWMPAAAVFLTTEFRGAYLRIPRNSAAAEI